MLQVNVYKDYNEPFWQILKEQFAIKESFIKSKIVR